jgi:esterase/lipase superfamily enzyme
MGVAGFLKKFRSSDFHTNSDLNVNGVIAMSAFYSPDRKREMGIDLPFDTHTGELRDDVWRRWKKFDPLQNVKNHIQDLKRMKVILQTGSRDEFSINIGMRGLSNILNDSGVDHEFMEYDAGHFGIDYFYERSLPELIKGLIH